MPRIPETLDLRPKPTKMTLANLSTQESIEAEFNPTELEESVAVNYNRLAVLGMSHKPLQYQQTENHTFDFELAFRVYDSEGHNRANDIEDARKFLLALTVPPRGAANVRDGAPPRILFTWPTLAEFTCVLTKLSFKHTLFDKSGFPTHFSAKITIEEVRDVRLFSDTIRSNGTRRPANKSGA